MKPALLSIKGSIHFLFECDGEQINQQEPLPVCEPSYIITTNQDTTFYNYVKIIKCYQNFVDFSVYHGMFYDEKSTPFPCEVFLFDNENHIQIIKKSLHLFNNQNLMLQLHDIILELENAREFERREKINHIILNFLNQTIQSKDNQETVNSAYDGLQKFKSLVEKSIK